MSLKANVLSAAPDYQDMTLLNPLEFAVGSFAAWCVNVLARLDVCSHMLFWTDGVASLGDEVALSKVELPRLGLSFDVVASGVAADDGLPRLVCIEHAGWFVSDERPAGVGAQLHHVLLLANAAGDTQMVVPNCRVRRVMCTDAPLCTEYVTFPESVAEQAAASGGERYFLVPFHTGPSEFLQVPPHRAAYALLLLLRVVVRDWAGAAALVEKLPMVDDGNLVPSSASDPNSAREGGCVASEARSCYNETVRVLREGESSNEVSAAAIVQSCRQQSLANDKTALYQVRVLLKLALRSRATDVFESSEALDRAFSAYLRGLDQMSAACQLSREQELTLADQFSDSQVIVERQCALRAAINAARVQGGADGVSAATGDSLLRPAPSTAKQMAAHRDGGALIALFEQRQARAELARAHAALSAEPPPPTPNAPTIKVETLDEEIQKPFWDYLPCRSSWKVELQWTVPEVPALPPKSLSAHAAAREGDEIAPASLRGTGITGFELLILEYDADAANDPAARPRKTSVVRFGLSKYRCDTLPARDVLKLNVRNSGARFERATPLHANVFAKINQPLCDATTATRPTR